MKLAVMRHGETDWNRQYKLQGQVDTELNENGRRMAAEAAVKFSGEQWTRCYYSPLKRTTETAEIVLAGRTIPRVADDRLMEMSFGIYEGTKRVIETPEHPLRAMFQEPEKYVADGGAESWEELFRRTGAFLRDCIAPLAETDEYVLIVGHGAMNLSIMNRICEIPIEHFWEHHSGNCEMQVFTIQNISDLHLDRKP